MIHIACNIDSHYVKYCGVMLISLFENNSDLRFTIHIVCTGLTERDQRTLSGLIQSYRHTVHYYTPPADLLRGFSIRKFKKRISLATYYRCVLAEVLPTNIDRVLYLDSDIIIQGSIATLWQMSLEDVGVAAVADTGTDEKQRYEVLAYPATYGYFNAGVLLINLAYWRSHHMGQACADYYQHYPERILFNDQDLLNSLLYEAKADIPITYNAQDGFYRLTPYFDEGWHKEHETTLRHPTILHFTNRKPWNYDSQHPLRHVYFDYLRLSPWAKDDVRRRPLACVKRFFRLIPFTLGLRPAKYYDL